MFLNYHKLHKNVTETLEIEPTWVSPGWGTTREWRVAIGSSLRDSVMTSHNPLTSERPADFHFKTNVVF